MVDMTTVGHNVVQFGFVSCQIVNTNGADDIRHGGGGEIQLLNDFLKEERKRTTNGYEYSVLHWIALDFEVV